MPPGVISLGELLVEIMRDKVDSPLGQPGVFLGPYPSGAPAIFLDAAARLGNSTGYIGVVGNDDFGRGIVTRLLSDQVDTSCIRVAKNLTTGIAFVGYHSDGNRSFIFHLSQSAAAELGPDDISPAFFADVKFVHITGSALSFSDTSRQACYKAADLCKQRGGRVSFDPNLRLELIGADRIRDLCEPLLRVCDVLLPSGSEASMLAVEPDEIKACLKLIQRNIPIIALKQGKMGSTIFTPSQMIKSDPITVTEIDPTGAGDCYGAGFITGLLNGWDLPKVARFANIVGALAVTKQGPMEGAPFLGDAMRILVDI
jgi:tagatose kinase